MNDTISKRSSVAGLEPPEALTGKIHSAEMLLEPPAPPRVPVKADANRVRPAGATAVTVLAFCNFESPIARDCR